MTLALILVVVGALLLPFMARWSFLVNGGAWLTGDSSVYALGPATDEWAHRTVFLIGFLVAAAFLARDRWLAAIVGYAGLQTFVLGPRVVSVYLLLGCLAIAVMRHAPYLIRTTTVTLLGWSAIVQAGLIVVQRLRGLEGVGTFGVSGLAAAYLVGAGMLVPGWLLPVIGLAVACTGSRAGLAAWCVGVAVRYGREWPAATLAALVFLTIIVGLTLAQSTSTSVRYQIQRDAMVSWLRTPLAVLGGFGLGAWHQHAMAQPIPFSAGDRYYGEPKRFLSAHNDALQWVYETGLIGTAFLALWFRRWRRAIMRPPFAPAYAALAVMALTWFPFHDLRLGMPAAVLIGLGTAD